MTDTIPLKLNNDPSGDCKVGINLNTSTSPSSTLDVNGDVKIGDGLSNDKKLIVNGDTTLSGTLKLRGPVSVSIAGTDYGITGQILTSNGSSTPSWKTFNKYILRLNKSSAQSITESTYTKVTLSVDTTVSTTGASSDFSTSTNIWTVPETGLYRMYLQCAITRPTSVGDDYGRINRGILGLYVDTTNNYIYTQRHNVNSDDGHDIHTLTLNLCGVIYLNKDSEVYMHAWGDARNNTTTGLLVLGNGSDSGNSDETGQVTWWTIERVYT